MRSWIEQKWARQKERDAHLVHPWRWRFLTLWIIIFTVAVGYSLRQSRNNNTIARKIGVENSAAIQRINDTTAKLKGLQKTNCGLVLFLLTARRARYDNYKRSHARADLEAVRGYEQLVKFYLSRTSVGEKCEIPARVQVPRRPLHIKDNT